MYNFLRARRARQQRRRFAVDASADEAEVEEATAAAPQRRRPPLDDPQAAWLAGSDDEEGPTDLDECGLLSSSDEEAVAVEAEADPDCSDEDWVPPPGHCVVAEHARGVQRQRSRPSPPAPQTRCSSPPTLTAPPPAPPPAAP